MKLTAEKQIVAAHFEAGAAWEAGATEQEMEPILLDIVTLNGAGTAYRVSTVFICTHLKSL